jgi:uncharacterized protein (TIGR02099 family)
MNEPSALTNDVDLPRLKRWVKLAAFSLGTLIILIMLLLGAFTLVMSRAPAYRLQMQAWLSERAKLDIQFDTISAAWRWYGPELVFTRLVVRSVDQQRVLGRAAQGGVGFDLWQAIRNGRLAAARLSLRGTEIKIQRRSDGDIEVVGQADWPEFETDTAFKLDSLPVGKLIIGEVRLSFRDLKTGRGPWLLDHVAADITRGVRRFDIDASASLPASLGKELNFTAHGEGKLDQVAALKWRTQLVGTELDLAGWTQVMPADWIAPATGQGSFQLKAEFVGAQPKRFSGRSDFVDVQMKLPHWRMPLPQADALQVRDDDPDNVPATAIAAQTSAEPTAVIATVTPGSLHYNHVGLAFAGLVTEPHWQIKFDRLQLERDGSPWSPGSAQLQLKLGDADAGHFIAQLQASINLIVLDNLWPLLAYLPETEANARLRALNASGRFMNVAINYERVSTEHAPSYGMRAEFAQLGVSPVGRTAGVNGLSGRFSATGARGELALDSRDVALSIPRVFRTPLPVDQVTSHLTWMRSEQGVQLSSQDFAVSNADGQVHAQFVLDVPRQGPAVIDMQATGTDLQAAAAPRYLPAGVMHKRMLAWMDAAFPVGVVKHAQATLHGPLDKFPFRGNEGWFLIKAQIQGLTMNYQAGWLPATDLNVDAEFRNAGLSATATAGRVNGMMLEHAEGRIKDFRDSELFIKAKTRGDLANALTFVQQSPVGPLIGNLFQHLSGKGELRGDTNMYFPLKEFAKRKVDIRLNLQNASVNLADTTQGIDALNGSLQVFNDAVVGAELRGQFLQGDFVTTTEMTGRGRYNIVANGALKSQPLVQFLKLPAWTRLEGAVRYRYTMPGYALRDEQGARHLYSVDSDMRGMSITLPAPVLKEANSTCNLHIDADLRGNDMLLRGALGELRALVRLQPVNDSWRFDRAGLRADGVAAALPGQPGLRIDGRVAAFTLDDWLKLGNSSGGDVSINAAGTRVQDILRAASVNIGRLRVYGFEWPEVRGILQATDAGWRVDVAGDKATGQVLVPYEFGSGKPLILNMESLWLNSIAAQNDKSRNSTAFDPRDLPSLRADIKRFHYGEHDFGTLQLSGARTAQGLQVSNLQISGDSFTGMGSGSWLQSTVGQQGSVALSIESNDVRATLQQFNYGDFIAAKHGKLIANLQWPGGLDENLLGRSSGTLEVQIDDGQLLNVQPGAGRVLGLFSVAALPRRLSLDFHDVTDKGLAFDQIHADFTVQNGDARTQNLLLRGPTAEIGIAGRMGLGARDYDQTAVVTGDVSSALPVAGVVAAGPVVGAALLLFSQIFKETLKGVARAYYHIGGSWEDPQVERIDAEVGKASLSGAAPEVAP